jgi:hypothetical protein
LVENAKEIVWPDEYLPQREDGHWLQLVAASVDPELVANPIEWIFLPVHGSAWKCDCEPGGSHNCDREDRRDHVDFVVIAPGEPGVAKVRLTAYYELNAVQSLLFTARVGKSGGTRCVIDYSLTAHLAGVGRLAPRALSIVTNDDAPGTHTLYVNGRADDPYSYTLTDGQIGSTAADAREYLFRAQVVPKTKDTFAYGRRNEKPRALFLDDLRVLAVIGYSLFSGLFPVVERRKRLVNSLRDASAKSDGRAVIQVSRTGGSTLAFPWYLVYDIPITGKGGKARPCSFLEKWDPESSELTTLPTRCPHEDEHGNDVLCPYGFWGFAHIVELPPYVDPDSPRRNSIREQALDSPLTITVGASPALDRDLTDAHMTALREVFGAKPVPSASGEQMLKALAEDVDVGYFYCHGDTQVSESGRVMGPLLMFTEIDKVAPRDVYAQADGVWPDTHWQERRPLIFINGCHTTNLSPEILAQFVSAFVGSRAAGVIGTEVSIHQQIANDAAQEFFRQIRGVNATVGSSIQRMRRALLAKGNVLGLAYTAYCVESLAVQPTVQS